MLWCMLKTCRTRNSPMPPAVASMMLLGTRLTSLPRTPVRLMAMKIQPSMNTAARACWYVTCVRVECREDGRHVPPRFAVVKGLEECMRQVEQNGEALAASTAFKAPNQKELCNIVTHHACVDRAWHREQNESEQGERVRKGRAEVQRTRLW